jgi:hypothetical protein
LALTAAASPACGSAKVGAARIATRFASFRLAQIALGIILLLSFGERKGCPAFSTSYLDIWHRYFLLRGARLMGGLALRFSDGAPGAPVFNGQAPAAHFTGAPKREAQALPLSLLKRASRTNGSRALETFERQRVYRTRGVAVQIY